MPKPKVSLPFHNSTFTIHNSRLLPIYQPQQPIESVDFRAGAVLLIDKPKDWTSFDVVNKVRGALRARLGVKKIKVGHAGTLDPMATGLLIVCTGKMTKRIDELQGLPKAYTGTMTMGATTPSMDAETEKDGDYPTAHLTPQLLDTAKAQFVGQISQLPPMYSAVKVKGQRLYKAARAGKVVEREARQVTIYDFDLVRVDLPEVDFFVRCSKGTYIRALAHDLGQAAGSGAYLSALRRTAIGEHELTNAWHLPDLITQLDSRG